MPSPPSDPAAGPALRRPPSLAIASPYFALAVLFSMNLLNYVDRYVFFAAGPRITKELGFDDAEFGVLSASFMVVYTLVAPLVGWLGDRYNRRRMLAFGVGLWSVATVGTAFARGYSDMFFWRALLGVGEASYGIIAPTLLSDLFTPKRRGRVIGLYYLALPLGGAIGYVIGGHFAEHGDWRHAFWIVGLPGVLAAVAGLMIFDPGRGASEGKAGFGKADRPGFREYLAILKTPSFLYNTAGQASVTFAIGAYAVWGPAFYNRVRGMDLAQAGRQIGALSGLAGLVGIVLGTVVADALRKVTRRAYLVWPTIAVAVAVPCGTIALLEPDRVRSLAFLFVASVMMASVLGPCNTVTANVVAANRRAAGFALSIFLIHLFGDISSPALIGRLSLLLGRPSVVDSTVGQAFAAVGATADLSGKVPSNLTAAMLSVVPMLALGCLFFLLGAKYLPGDQERAQPRGVGRAGRAARPLAPPSARWVVWPRPRGPACGSRPIAEDMATRPWPCYPDRRLASAKEARPHLLIWGQFAFGVRLGEPGRGGRATVEPVPASRATSLPAAARTVGESSLSAISRSRARTSGESLPSIASTALARTVSSASCERRRSQTTGSRSSRSFTRGITEARISARGLAISRPIAIWSFDSPRVFRTSSASCGMPGSASWSRRRIMSSVIRLGRAANEESTCWRTSPLCGSSRYFTAGAARASIGTMPRQATAATRTRGSRSASRSRVGSWNRSFHSSRLCSSARVIGRPGVHDQSRATAPSAAARTSGAGSLSPELSRSNDGTNALIQTVGAGSGANFVRIGATAATAVARPAVVANFR